MRLQSIRCVYNMATSTANKSIKKPVQGLNGRIREIHYKMINMNLTINHWEMAHLVSDPEHHFKINNILIIRMRDNTLIWRPLQTAKRLIFLQIFIEEQTMLDIQLTELFHTREIATALEADDVQMLSLFFRVKKSNLNFQTITQFFNDKNIKNLDNYFIWLMINSVISLDQEITKYSLEKW